MNKLDLKSLQDLQSQTIDYLAMSMSEGSLAPKDAVAVLALLLNNEALTTLEPEPEPSSIAGGFKVILPSYNYDVEPIPVKE
jgi:hypothetical protein